GIHADPVVSERVARRESAGGHADREVVLRRSQGVPQPAAASGQPLDHPEGAGAVVRPDRLAAVAIDDGAPARRDLADRLVPADSLEPSLALWPDAAERMEQPVRELGVLEVVVHLHAQRTARVRVLAVAQELHGSPVLDGDDPAAGVGAVERADAVDVAY